MESARQKGAKRVSANVRRGDCDGGEGRGDGGNREGKWSLGKKSNRARLQAFFTLSFFFNSSSSFFI